MNKVSFVCISFLKREYIISMCTFHTSIIIFLLQNSWEVVKNALIIIIDKHRHRLFRNDAQPYLADDTRIHGAELMRQSRKRIGCMEFSTKADAHSIIVLLFQIDHAHNFFILPYSNFKSLLFIWNILVTTYDAYKATIYNILLSVRSVCRN